MVVMIRLMGLVDVVFCFATLISGELFQSQIGIYSKDTVRMKI